LGKSRTNFDRGFQKRSPEEDDDDFDWRKELDREEREEREYKKRIKELGLDSEQGREADIIEGDINGD
jgi:hypothetical protein